MPIRMVDDQDNQDDYNPQNDNSGSGGGGFNTGGGGGGGLMSFLPLIFSLFGGGGGGKKIILLLVIAAAAFFLMRNGSCSGGSGGLSDVIAKFATGGKLDPNQFKKASVYEGLSDDDAKNPLPEAVSLARYAPDRGDQGHQGSCVAWSSAYAARTILQSVSTHQDPNAIKYSPSFLYNNIGLDGCEGSYIIRAMEFMQQKGAVPLAQFPYNDQSCSDQGQSLMGLAASNKIHGFNRLTDDDGVSVLNFRAIKEHLAKDAPVVIGMMVGGSFMQDMMGQKVWHPTQDDYTMQGFGGHAMCVIGYDDRVEGGAFQIMNSWGPKWGDNGIGYVRYSDFRRFVREAYGVDPLPKSGAALNVDFECNIGLVNNTTKQYIPLRAGSGNVFTTTSPITKGTRFKLELKNALECYAYIFGQETDGSSYVLFPYKPIHSPYFGVTGYRLFPRKESMMADSIGNKDFMAIVVSKQPLDYTALNTAISKSTQATYAGKLNEAISSMAISNVKFSNNSSGNIYFKADASEQKTVVGCVVEIDKQ
ncbi:C1 family peptidase [Ferruginibacter sp.]